MSANDRQVGGDHYRKTPGEQHWDRVVRLGMNYFQAMVTRYVERYPHKGGLTDLEKARHFLDKLIEVERARLGYRSQPAAGGGKAPDESADLREKEDAYNACLEARAALGEPAMTPAGSVPVNGPDGSYAPGRWGDPNTPPADRSGS